MKLFRHVLAVAIAAGLAHCGGGDDDTIRVFIQTDGSGSCSDVAIVLDLATAGAKVARSRDRNPDCRLDDALVELGCQARFLETNDRDELRITIDECDVPGAALLGSCEFLTTGFGDLADHVTTSSCTCANGPCDEEPPVCFDDDEAACTD